MITSKLLRRLLVFAIFSFSVCIGNEIIAQNCTSSFSLNPVKQNNLIEWDKFPSFDLPVRVIYGGPRFNDQDSKPLKHGFSHLSNFSGPEGNNLPPEKRAFLWYGVATPDGQPWGIRELSSPWGNNMDVYRAHWDHLAGAFAELFQDSRGSGIPRAEIICLDVERMKATDREIILLKSAPQIPDSYKALSDEVFLNTYKRDIRGLYSAALQHLKNKNLPAYTKISNYSDTPVRGTWLNISANSWTDWTTNKTRTHYLMHDDQGNIGGDVYNQLDVLTPSPYYYYAFDNPLGKDYLSYLLFQIEVNKAWSNKPVIPFVWLRYHDAYNEVSNWVEPFMAEATAIFPFFSGASGLWLWDNPGVERENKNFATYEHFVNGLYRLSQFKHFLEGNYQLVIPQPARDLMEQEKTIWRGIAKNNEILIAAHNPFAANNEETSVFLQYGNWTRTIKLKGKEVHLCSYSLDDTVTANPEPLAEVGFGPNPSAGILNLIVNHGQQLPERISLKNMLGISVFEQELNTSAGNASLDLSHLPPGIYVVQLEKDGQRLHKKWVLSR